MESREETAVGLLGREVLSISRTKGASVEWLHQKQACDACMAGWTRGRATGGSSQSKSPGVFHQCKSHRQNRSSFFKSRQGGETRDKPHRSGELNWWPADSLPSTLLCPALLAAFCFGSAVHSRDRRFQGRIPCMQNPSPPKF